MGGVLSVWRFRVQAGFLKLKGFWVLEGGSAQLDDCWIAQPLTIEGLGFMQSEEDSNEGRVISLGIMS